MQGHDADDPVCADRPAEPTLPRSTAASTACASRSPAAISARALRRKRCEAIERVAKALDASREIEIPEAERARAAAYVITATEGAALHLDRLRTRAERFRSRGARPADRRRDGAGGAGQSGAEIPPLVSRAQVLELFDDVDVILAPATPCTAPQIGQQTFVLDGVEMPLRPNIGIYTQPISFIGLPVVAVPVPLDAAADRACRSSPRRGARTWRCAWRMRWNKRASPALRGRISRETPMSISRIRSQS